MTERKFGCFAAAAVGTVVVAAAVDEMNNAGVGPRKAVDQRHLPRSELSDAGLSRSPDCSSQPEKGLLSDRDPSRGRPREPRVEKGDATSNPGVLAYSANPAVVAGLWNSSAGQCG